MDVRKNILFVAFFSVAACTLAGCGKKPREHTNQASAVDVPATIAEAKACWAGRNTLRANQLVKKVLLADQNNVQALELAGDLAVVSRDSAKAVAFFDQAVQLTKKPSAELIDKLGGQWMMIGRPFNSLSTLETAVRLYPDIADFRVKMVGVMVSMGLEREAVEHVRWLVQRGHGTVDLLTILIDLDRPQTNVGRCKFAIETHPDDLRPAYALARKDVHAGRWDAVKPALQKVIQAHPEFLPAQSYYLRSLVELNDADAIDKWTTQKPNEIESRPEYWIAAGLWADKQGQHEQAAQAFWQAVQLADNNYEAHGHLARSLKLMERDEDSKVVDDRARKLIAVRDTTDNFFAWKKNSQTSVVELSKQLHDLGRSWEATAWLQVAFKMDQHPDATLKDVYSKYRDELKGTMPWQDPQKLVANKLDLSSLAPFAWKSTSASHVDESIVVDAAKFRFVDQATAWGLKHVCAVKDSDGKEGGLAIYQTGVGGAGVIDFDLDGQPDLYLTVSDGTPKKRDSATNRLYRNERGKFTDVTFMSFATETGYSQGVTAGDYNADGFADLVIANIGQNRLLRNNGDGTFSDVSDTAGMVNNEWTTSIAMADLDGDGLNDLFQAGYCAGDEPLNQPCYRDGEERSCVPVAFEAQADRVMKGQADGSFIDVTNNWLGQHAKGYGFAVVVGTLDGNPGLDVYVANDTTGNHYWASSESDPRLPASFQLTESATIRGLAFNVRSIAQASMGIAAGDGDGDGDVDLFLTHFTNDYDTFYQQIQPGMWSDRTTLLGLASTTDAMLGFGTQWIDANNDGRLELLVGNGHIDDFTKSGGTFRMPMQLFYRTTQNKFADVDAESIGEFFGKSHLVRAVATLDANSDGRMDAVATRLYDPVALLINETETTQQSIQVYLKGTACARDAIGTQVQYTLDGKKRNDQLIGGDGFQCTNQKCVTLGVGDQTQIEDVQIQWPDGTSTNIGVLTSGQNYLIVQGDETPFELSR